MKKEKSTPEKEVKDYTFEIVENGHTFELQKITKGVIEKIFIQSHTNLKAFKAAAKKYQK